MLYTNIREEELKNQIARDYFGDFDCTKIIGNVDFCVSLPKSLNYLNVISETQSFAWMEAKKGKSNIYTSFVQLILTIGKARTFDKELPPSFLGAFDSFQMAFVPYSDIQEIFYQNDFNWNVTPSNYETREFKQIHSKVETILSNQSLIFSFEIDQKELREFIKVNFVVGKIETSKIQIDKNNFITIYNKWLKEVKPSIILNWQMARSKNLFDADFYLADLLSGENETLKEKLSVLLKKDHYELERTLDELGLWNIRKTNFNDKQKAHTQFWNRYQRPPKSQYWDYIVERRDLLVPQDVRERKGSFFTPQIWVEKSQEYLTQVFGENWQDEYYIWDCCAGTGNLLTGLTNKYNIFASTLDQQDVDVIYSRIETMNQNSVSGDGANLVESNVFQFDFLNDSFDNPKVPKELKQILKNPEKRKKLIIYINPPYAEATTGRTISKTGKNKPGVAKNKMNDKYKEKISKAANELFVLFMARIYDQIKNAHLALFSTMKYAQSSNFVKFREYFLAEFKKGFVIPADTFDNVKGKFPIGFVIWNTAKKEKINKISCDVYDAKNYKSGQKISTKEFDGELGESINKWIKKFRDKQDEIGLMVSCAPDFQHNNQLTILSKKQARYCLSITKKNLIPFVVYFAVRHCIKANWLNDRDQFLFPNNAWKTDTEFQNDCLIFTLFHSQNRIIPKEDANHWIPFTEMQVNSRAKFKSDFMAKFISGKIKLENDYQIDLQDLDNFVPTKPLEFSPQAKAVFEAGLELWRYYHKYALGKSFERTGAFYNPNASLYDIREYFQGRSETEKSEIEIDKIEKSGRMNNSSKDEKYNLLVDNLRKNMEVLGAKIGVKVYEFEFLK